MTTTMESDIDLLNPTETSPQQQAQAQADPPSTTPPVVPGNTGDHHLPPDDDTDGILARAEKKQRDEELRALSKTFGHILGAPVFSTWEKRQDCCDAAVHRSIMAGICGNTKDGAFSVALSSLYPDDEDGGDVIIYTGAGGREQWTNTSPPKRLKVGPQTKDQSWDHPQNKALIVSFLSGKPVRVIRSWKCPSQYAPLKGLRYDGLYRVAAHWTAKGQNGKNICRCRLERLPDQPRIPLRPITFSTRQKRGRKRLASPFSPSLSPATDSYDILNETDSCTASNHTNPSTAQLAGSTGGEPGVLSNPPHQQAMPETFSGVDSIMAEADADVKERLPPPIQRGLSPKHSAIPRYRWDKKNKQLIPLKFPAFDPVPADSEAEEYRRGEDDVTLVASEDGLFDMPANERIGTEYFTDRGTPPPGTPHDDLLASIWGEQGYH